MPRLRQVLHTRPVEVVTVRSVVELEVTVDYSLYERAALLIQAAGAKLADPQFTDRVTLRWQMPEGTEPPLLEQLRELTRLASLNVAQEAKVSRSISSVRCRTSIRNPHFLFSPPPLARRSRSPCRGRVRPEEQDPIRPVFQRDRDRIIHCKAFRRLKQKTQVFLSPEGDLYRTRLTHTLEVAQIARTIARALRLNEDLTEAISLAHDLGHTPFGHAGESALDKLCPEGFRHYMQSLRVVELIL